MTVDTTISRGSRNRIALSVAALACVLSLAAPAASSAAYDQSAKNVIQSIGR